MITPAFAQTMSLYNSEMNRRFYSAASRLSDEDRRANRGSFWSSIHGTLSHLLWADHMWMSRFAGWDKPSVPLAQTATAYKSFGQMAEVRATTDAAISVWAANLTPEWIAGDQAWFSGAAQKDVTAPRGLLLAHFYNHQTHHRGQVHAMLTAQGEKTGDTDLWIVVAN